MMNTSPNEAARIRWVEQALKQLPKGIRLLDAGAGEQQYRQFCDHLIYTSQDFAAYNPADAPEGLQMNKWNYGTLDIVSDITAIPRPDASFDAILCTEVFEHIPDPAGAIREFSRLLKQNGTLIVTAPFCSMTHFAPYHYFTGFSRYFYETLLPANGFKIEKLQANGNYFSYMSQEAGRIPHVAKNYSLASPGFIEKIAFRIIGRYLQRLKQQDDRSEELMCFGWHVIATKR